MALDWFKRKMAILSMSMSHAEKVALTNKGQSVELEAGVHQRLNQGSLKDALINGELTEEVKDLRWRMYKVLDAAENKKVAKFSGYDEETGNPIYEMVTVDPSKINLTKIKRDDFDDYPVILVVKNDEIVLGKVDATEGEFDAIKEGLKSIDGYVGEGKGVATISKSSYDSTVKTYRPILINRENVCTNPFENYATKLMVRRITDEEFLLEFYVSIYPDMYDVKTKFLIAEIKRAIENPRSTDILNIQNVCFVTDNTLGAKNNLLYEYEIIDFDKIVKFNGSYVIKFKAKPITIGQSITAKYVREELEAKYRDKDAK